MSTDVDSFLAHYGVKGMKWGVQKKDPNRKSNHRVNLEGHFIKKGMSPVEAEAAAERRIKVEKVIAIAGAATVAAAVGYAAGRYIGREFVDVKLKEGTPLQHVTSTGDLQLKDMPFFTTFHKADKKNIHALFPQTYQVDLKTKVPVTAPSNLKARQMLSEVLGQKKTMNSAEYAKFNYRYFYDDDPKSQKVVSDFFGKIKDAGYNSVLDPKPGGYRSIAGVARLHKPLILLDGANTAVKTGQKAVSESFRNKIITVNLAKSTASGLSGTVAAAGLGLSVGGYTNAKMKTQAIDDYFKQHPTSTYSRSEISALLVANNTGYEVKPKK